MGALGKVAQVARVLWRGRGRPTGGLGSGGSGALLPRAATAQSAKNQRIARKRIQTLGCPCHCSNKLLLKEVQKVNRQLEQLVPEGHNKWKVFGEISATSFLGAVLRVSSDDILAYLKTQVQRLKSGVCQQARLQPKGAQTLWSEVDPW